MLYAKYPFVILQIDLRCREGLFASIKVDHINPLQVTGSHLVQSSELRLVKTKIGTSRVLVYYLQTPEARPWTVVLAVV